MNETFDRVMSRINAVRTSVRTKEAYGEVFFSYVPTQEVFLAGRREGLTQEQFTEKWRQSKLNVCDIFQRINTPKAKGYRAIQKQAIREFKELIPNFSQDLQEGGRE
jgi:hypothetical protein